MTAQTRIVGIGNALVDVLASVEPAIVARHALTPGGMHLVDDTAAEALYAEVGPGVMQSGGSVANTIAHLAAAGQAASFIGRVAEDTLGAAFVADLEALGADCPLVPVAGGAGTGRCVVLVTPDGERTMSTFLGAAQEITPEEASAGVPADTAMLIVEGYLFDAPAGAAAIEAAVERARAARARIVLTPSDAGCVARHLEAMRAFIADPCHVLIGNEAEMMALSGEDSAEAALDWAARHAETAVVTRSGEGALVAEGDHRAAVAAEAVAEVVDTTGAGDAFAAGFLGALVRGDDAEAAARAGCRLAAGVITHMGARRHAA